MASEVQLPELGENIDSGVVVDIKIAPGTEVRAGQPLVEVEAEKASLEVPSPLDGRVAKILVKKGDTVRPGQPLGLIEGPDGQAPAEGREKAAAKPEKRAAAEKPTTPEKPAQKTEEGPDRKEEPPAEGKEAPAERKAPPTERDGAGKPAPAPRRADAAPLAKPEAGVVVAAGPATRRLARELGVNLAQVTGTGPHGRITRDDVKAFVRQITTRATPFQGVPPSLPDFAQWGPVERKPLDNIRRRTAEQVSLAWSLIPHVTQHDL